LVESDRQPAVVDGVGRGLGHGDLVAKRRAQFKTFPAAPACAGRRRS
jgi:hypothetical protein